MPVAQAAVPVLAGSAGMSRRRFLGANAVGSALWSGFYVGAGFMVGMSAQRSDAPSALVLAAGLAAALAVSWMISRVASSVFRDTRDSTQASAAGVPVEVSS